MATLSSQAVALSTSSCFHTGLSKVKVPSAVPVRQNGSIVKVSASSCEDRCSRRDAMAVVGGAGLVGLLSLLSAGSAEAARAKPETRKKIREELEKIKEKAVKLSEEGKKSVQSSVQGVANKVAKK